MAFGDSQFTAAATLLQCGPPLVLFCCIIAPRSLLIIAALTSAFVWASALLLVSALLQGLLAGDASPFRFALIVTLSVILEEAVRWWLYTIHRRMARHLAITALKNSSWRFSSADKPVAQVLLGFAIGYGQAMAHVLVFSVSWLPLTAGKGVLYAGGCSSMSHALAAALTMLGFFLLHAGSTVVAFDGAAQKHWVQAAVPGIVHLAAALLTVLNVRHNSCAAVGGGAIAVSSAMMAWAAYVYYRQKAAPQAYERVPNERPGIDDQT